MDNLDKNLLIIKTNKEKLHDEEFVKPVIDIIKNKISHIEITSIFDSPRDLSSFRSIIITGTSVQDMEYKKHINKWGKEIKEFRGKLLGICAGMQVLAASHNIKLKKCLSIGVKKVKINNKRLKVYDLHQYSVEKSEKIKVLAKHRCIEMFKVKGRKHYGTAFHPEVLNKDMLLDFLEETSLTF